MDGAGLQTVHTEIKNVLNSLQHFLPNAVSLLSLHFGYMQRPKEKPYHKSSSILVKRLHQTCNSSLVYVKCARDKTTTAVCMHCTCSHSASTTQVRASKLFATKLEEKKNSQNSCIISFYSWDKMKTESWMTIGIWKELNAMYD